MMSSPSMFDDEGGSSRRLKRKPNFTPEERLHLVRSYVDNLVEYNRGFTLATKGEHKHGRQRLLEKWAAELTAFGVVQRTTVEVEQKLRDYMKKISAHRKRTVKRPLSPAAELLNSVVPVYVSPNSVESSEQSCPDYLTFLLQQQRRMCCNNPVALEDDSCADNGSVDGTGDLLLTEMENSQSHSNYVGTESRVASPDHKKPLLNINDANDILDDSGETEPIDSLQRLQYKLLQQQLENARADYTIKQIIIKNARTDLKIKNIELKTRKLQLLRLEQGENGDHAAFKMCNEDF